MIIGYTYVVGDILHKGHIIYLKKSKALCDKLIVGVLTDKAVMEKKPKPILSFYERMEIIESIKYVDLVVPQNEYDPSKNLSFMKPDILFESTSHSDIGNNQGRKVVVFSYYAGQSSTKIKNEVRSGDSV